MNPFKSVILKDEIFKTFHQNEKVKDLSEDEAFTKLITIYRFEILEYQKRIEEFEKDFGWYLPQAYKKRDKEVNQFARQVHFYVQSMTKTSSQSPEKNYHQEEELIEKKVQSQVEKVKNKLFESVIQSYFIASLVLLILAITTEKVSWRECCYAMILIALFVILSFYWFKAEEFVSKNLELLSKDSDNCFKGNPVAENFF